MILDELVEILRLDVDAASFAKGQLAADGIKLAFRAVAAAARAVGREILDATVGTVKAADRIDEMAQATGVSTTALQELAYAGSFSSLSMDEMGQAFGFLSRNMLNAKEGGKEAAKAFSAIGVRATDASGNLRSSDDVLGDVAEAFATTIPEAEKAGRAMDLFGRGGKKMVPLLNEGRAGLQRLREEAHAMGIVLDEAFIKRARDVDDNMNRLSFAWQGLKMQVGQKLLPVLERLVTWATGWIQKNREAIKAGLEKAFKALIVVGKILYKTILEPMGKVLSFLLRHWRLVLLTLTPLIVMFAASMVSAGIAMAAAWLAAAAPIILISGLILLAILLVEDFVTMLEGGDSVIGDLLNRLKQWLGWDPTDSAFTAGLKVVIETVMDFGKAWEDAWTDIKRYAREFFEWLDAQINRFLPKIRSLPGIQKAMKEAEKNLPPPPAGAEKQALGKLGFGAGTEAVKDVASWFMGTRLPSLAELPARASAQGRPVVQQANSFQVTFQGPVEESAVPKIKEQFEQFMSVKLREAAAGVR